MKDNFVTMATGTRVSRTKGSPTIYDMAFQLGRICRWVGALEFYWPVLLHCFVVADVLPPELKVYGLIHDSIECVGNDVPKPMKFWVTSKLEDRLMERIHQALCLPALTNDEQKVIKLADVMVRHAEAWALGNDGQKATYPCRYEGIEDLVGSYRKEFPVLDCVLRDGKGPVEFIRRFREYREILDRRNSRAVR